MNSFTMAQAAQRAAPYHPLPSDVIIRQTQKPWTCFGLQSIDVQKEPLSQQPQPRDSPTATAEHDCVFNQAQL